MSKKLSESQEIILTEYLNTMTAQVHDTAVKHGWHGGERPEGYETMLEDIKCLSLIASEAFEAIDGIRKNGYAADEHCPDFSALEIELADVVIRIMDFAGLRNLRLGKAIMAKMKYNETRKYRHGGKNF